LRVTDQVCVIPAAVEVARMPCLDAVDGIVRDREGGQEDGG
jgi:hypothetical protein